MQHANVINRLKNREATIGIIGLGYVGLPLALRYAEVGYKVLGFDIDSSKVNKINSGQSYFEHISDDKVATAKHYGLSATTDFSRAGEADALILCVPTPLNKYREPDLTCVLQTTETLIPYIRAGQVVSLESTTYPGTTEEELLPRIESKGLKVGKDIFLVFSPEREDPGNPNYHTAIIPKVCGGVTPACLEVGTALYEQVVSKVVKVSSTRAAEMTKLLENIHRAVNIGLVNEMKQVADAMGINIFEVIHAAASKPFGFVPYYPGPGIGGHCIPIDPFYLTWKAREFGLHTRFIELAGEINHNMPNYVVTKVIAALNAREKSVKNSKILVLGAAYKKNVDDMRESPSVVIMDILIKQGANVDYSDPHVPELPELRFYDLHLTSKELSPAMVASYDCVVIATAHDKFDYEMIKQSAQLIVDTRGIYYQENADNIVNA